MCLYMIQKTNQVANDTEMTARRHTGVLGHSVLRSTYLSTTGSSYLCSTSREKRHIVFGIHAVRILLPSVPGT